MASITYENKVALNVDPTIPDKNKCTAGDMNEIKSVVNGKQDELVSGTSIKTINDISILGSGNITISETTPTITYSQTANTDVGNATTRRLDLDTLNVGTYIYYNYTATSAFYFKYTKPNASTKTNLMIPNSTGSEYSIGSTGANYRTVEVEMYKKTSEIASMSAAANEAVCKITLKAVKPGYSSRRSNAADSQTISYFIYKNNDDGTLAVGYAGEITNTYLIDAKMNDKQDKLVSGTNIKTINNNSLLGSGNISLEATPEISIGTTTPSGDEVLWINPEDTPSGSLNPITNEYSEATDKGYSCNYLNNSDSYSTNEIKTNKRWIDGKPIYRKVVDIGNMTSPVNHNITNLGTIINFDGVVKGGDSSPYDAYFPVSFANKNGLDYQISAFIQGSQIKFNKGSGLTIVSGYLIIEYTKTTD